MIMGYMNRLAALLRETNSDRLLIVRQTPMMDSEYQYSLTWGLLRNTIPHGTKIAVVDDHDNEPRMIAIALAAGRKAGLDMQGFDTIKAAETWLLA